MLQRVDKTAGGPNRMEHRGPADPHRPTIVRQSPDLLYSACAFDLDAGAVQVEVGPTEGYLSVAFFDRATNNFRTLTPKDLAATNGPVTLVSARHTAPPDTGVVVQSPTQRGIILIRRRISTDESLARMLKAQTGDHCQVIAG